ncbi:Hypothetical protein GbCGDNIH2_1343 [Granulibacter bethesdensis]|nr:Hypothetical protein GbCGDNIH2_1343 [Granulibacter bethesdensis]
MACNRRRGKRNFTSLKQGDPQASPQPTAIGHHHGAAVMPSLRRLIPAARPIHITLPALLATLGWMVMFAPARAQPAPNRASPAGFAITFAEFKIAFNNQAQADQPGHASASPSGSLKRCKHITGGISCLIRNRDGDAPPPPIEPTNRIKLPPGRVPQPLRLEARLNPDGRIVTLRILGDRAEQVDHANFVAAVENAAQVWDQQEGLPPQSARFDEALGLNRTDEAPDIGQPRILTRPYAKITCIASALSANAGVGCTFDPPDRSP